MAERMSMIPQDYRSIFGVQECDSCHESTATLEKMRGRTVVATRCIDCAQRLERARVRRADKTRTSNEAVTFLDIAASRWDHGGRSTTGGPKMVDLSAIAEADLLRGFSEPELAELGAIASLQEFSQRDCLFKREEEPSTLYIATRGRFALTVDLRVFDNRVDLAVEDKGALDAFGWSSLVEPRMSIYSCYCTEDGAAVTFPRDRLEALMTANCRLGEQFLRNLNELIGTRVRVLQKLWLDEVSQSTSRVQHWSQAELTTRWSAAMAEPRSRPARRWLR